MSKYTTGELAKLCGVTVRTVQYYDTREILVPSALTEGGRRLYSEQDVKRLRVICFLRELGLSIDSIRQLLQEEDPGSVIALLLEQQQAVLKQELAQREEKLCKLEELKAGLKSVEQFSVESIGDIAFFMTTRKKLRCIRVTMLLTGLPINILQWAAIYLWVAKGIWWPFVLWVAAAIPWGILLTRYYHKNISYLCPKCHTVFRPGFKEMFFAAHTPSARKLTCTGCGHHGFCVEVAVEQEEEKHGSDSI